MTRQDIKRLIVEMLWWIYLYLWGVTVGWKNSISGIVIGLLGIVVGIIVGLTIYRLRDKWRTTHQ